ncbi:GGDEF domain-containing protein [Mesobacillus maritimus]|uniref:GGDEF domain-containing protein n=1 Tax=Mesobacillus maritimus TaxID=1643336 RepID=UPI00384B1739
MKFSLYMDDSETEKLFSYLRWIVAIVAFIMFYFPPLSERLQYDSTSFPLLFGLSIAYISLAQFALTRFSKKEKYFTILTKGGILFDFIAFFWLLALTGEVLSPIFPVAFLIIMHATIYWRTKGAVFSSIGVTVGYSALLLIGETWTFETIFVFIMNSFFVWIVGLFGSMIVLRERLHMKQKEIFKELMITDYLTGLFNHRSFQEQIRLLASGSKSFTLILGDIDHFKYVNDTYGHMAGDLVLKEIGHIFHELANEYKGVAFRYGGEEFAFLLSESSPTHIEAFMSDLYTGLKEKSFTEDRLRITMSFGGATSSQFDSIDRLVVSVDQLLYKAKASGRNQAIVYAGKSTICYQNSSILNKETITSLT